MSAIRVRSTVATVAVVLCLLCGLAQGATIFVKADAAGANNGTSWSNAFNELQSALNAAASGDEVWVAAGTYVGCITLKDGVALYGGFAGGETDLAQRDWVTNKTILDGNQAGSVVTSPSGATATTRIDGFTIRNGSGTVSGASQSYWCGGGIYCAGSPTITNNIITVNGATLGGAIYCHYSSARIANNAITRNNVTGFFEDAGCDTYGASGGGIYCSYSHPTIENNAISENAASGPYGTRGGGIYCHLYSSPMISDNTVTGNAASGTHGGSGGGIYCHSHSSSTMANNLIVGNSAGSSDHAGSGGGIYCTNSSPTITNNTITGNTAFVYLGGGGGGIYCNYSLPTIANTIIAFNTSGLRWIGETAALSHSCVFGNAAYDYSGLTDPTGTDGNISADPLFVRPANAGADGQWGTADDDYGDLQLQAGSPCIDAGDNAALPIDAFDLDGDGDVTEPIPFDLAGMPRFVDDLLTPDTGLGTPPIVDMGAYEYAPVVLQSAMPASGKSLWRNQKNIIRLTFDADIVAPDVGAVMIQEMVAGGAYGDDLSADFTFIVENDGQGQPRVLKIRETASSLTHRKWYAVRNTGAWAGVAPFTVQYVVQVGDANNDGRVLNTDFGVVNAAIPNFDAADDDRRDINGDGRILNTDFGVLNSKIPSFTVAKPSGH